MTDANPTSAYQQNAAGAAGPVRLVVLLYEQLVRDLRRILSAAEQGDIQRRVNETNHALEVLAQLQGRLDLQRGGEVAFNLNRFYDLLRTILLQAQNRSYAGILNRQIENILQLRQAWTEVERTESPVPGSVGNASASSTSEVQPRNWTAE